MATKRLILASGSRYRRQQLTAAGFEFDTIAPNVDESPQPHEKPSELAHRLAFAKARAVLTSRPNAVVIGGDQVCAIGDRALGKPGNAVTAIAHLKLISNCLVTFYSAVAVMSSNRTAQFSVSTEVEMRKLQEEEITRYVSLDQPFDTAAAIKAEQRGPLLFNRVTSDDPSALIGLPLIQLAATLREFGINPLLEGDSSS